jgi:hypothetical protein
MNNYIYSVVKAKKYNYLTSVIIVVGLVFFVALSVSRNHLIANYSNSSTDLSIYEEFYTNNSEKNLDNQECGNSLDLSDRHRLRWVFWKAKTKIYDLAKDFFGFTGVGAVFSLLHALIVSITFWFTYNNMLMLLALIFKEQTTFVIDKKNIGILLINALIFLILFVYSFNGQVGEYNYSVTEALFVSLAFYGALKRKIIFFTIVVSLAVLSRESGFVLLAIWVLLNGLELRKIYKNYYLLIPPAVFFIANFNMMHCIFNDNFLVSSNPLPGQLTYHIFLEGVWGFIRGVVAVMFNYGVFLIPTIFAFKWIRNIDGLNASIVNKIFILICLYVLVFLVATPLNHMSVKFVIAPIISVILATYILGLVTEWNIVNKSKDD